MRLPLFAAGGVGETAEMGTSSGTLGAMTASGTGVSGCVGAGAAELAPLEASGRDGGGIEAALILPAVELAGVGVAGVVIDGALRFRSPTADGTLTGPSDLVSVSLSFPALTADGDGAAGAALSVSLDFPALTGSGALFSENPGTGSLTLPALTASGTGYGAATGTGAGTFPALTGDGIMETALPSLGVAVSFVNLREGAVSDWETYAFNSYAAPNGRHLAAKTDGIWELIGDTDNADEIFAEFAKIGFDLENFYKKRLTDAYFHLHSGGPYEIRLQADGSSRTLAAADTGGGIHTYKLNLPRGLKGQTIGIGLANREGADLTVDEMYFVAEETSRRNR